MATPLHSSSTLAAMANDPSSLVRAWARSRLLLQEPTQIAFLPEDEGVLIAAHLMPEGLHELLTSSLRAEDPEVVVTAAAGFAHLATSGALPAPDSDLVKAARAAVDRVPDASRPVALGLAYLGQLDPHVVQLATSVQDELEDLPLSAVILLSLAQSSGKLDEVALTIAESLREPLADDPEILDATLAMLFVPVLPYDLEGEPLRTVEAAVITGAAMTGVAPKNIPNPKGSKRRRAQNALLELLDGVTHPAAALLKAIAHADLLPKDPLALLATASWLAHHEPRDPLTSVLEDIAVGDALILTQARKTVDPTHRLEVLEGIAQDPSSEVLSVALELCRGGDEEIAAQALDAIVQEFTTGVLMDEYTVLAALAYDPDRIADWLRDDNLRSLGFATASWFPTEEVLSELLALPAPASPDERAAYVWCLAGMGDRAALERLQVLARVDDSEDITGALEEAQALLGVHA